VKKISNILLVIIIFILAAPQFVFANPIDWKNEQAYHPMPVLFIHGINSNAQTWTTSISILKQYITNQYRIKYYDSGIRGIRGHNTYLWITSTQQVPKTEPSCDPILKKQKEAPIRHQERTLWPASRA